MWIKHMEKNSQNTAKREIHLGKVVYNFIRENEDLRIPFNAMKEKVKKDEDALEEPKAKQSKMETDDVGYTEVKKSKSG